MRFDPAPIANYDLSSLKCLGTVGEPINPEAWRWYFTHVGRGSCSVSDTYWQTETGGHMATNLPGLHPMKPGSCAVPYYGIEFAIVDPQSGKELEGNGVEGVLCIKHPWPSIARTVYGDHERFLNVYTKPYPGKNISSGFFNAVATSLWLFGSNPQCRRFFVSGHFSLVMPTRSTILDSCCLS